MFKDLQKIFTALVKQESLTPSAEEPASPEILNRAFLTALCGPEHDESDRALELLEQARRSETLGTVAEFYLDGIQRVEREINNRCDGDAGFRQNLQELAVATTTGVAKWGAEETPEQFWKVFFPEALGILGNTETAADTLRGCRGVTITRLNERPILDVGRELLFTSNVLLTLPQADSPIDALPISHGLKDRVEAVFREPQRYWYDHPIHIGVEPGANEIIYGLRGLETAVEFEKARGNLAADGRVTCLLSVSVTHEGLKAIAKDYVEEALSGSEPLRNLDIYIFTETDTGRLTENFLMPLAARLGKENRESLKGLLGVDGEYGRHYSFLKAITALWSLTREPAVRGTFKIDLDQVFPQEALVEETGRSAFEHLRNPRWGADARDSNGEAVALGMIAGALVNERDIGRGLFTPDVPYPDGATALDEHLFFSTLPQALSTEAEMMTRYGADGIDGKEKAIQRIHVTGGTNGILVKHLRRHRPFVPSFISRAEDQAYILSTFGGEGPGLAYVHEDGLFMRHDKEAFAQEAIESAYVGKLIGDYIRILYFSRYARLIDDDIRNIKEKIDPFTGCFVSPIPETITYLRFALKAVELFAAGKREQANEFVTTGASRIIDALAFSDAGGPMKQRLETERSGWALYYDLLDGLEQGLERRDRELMILSETGRSILETCRIDN